MLADSTLIPSALLRNRESPLKNSCVVTTSGYPPPKLLLENNMVLKHQTK